MSMDKDPLTNFNTLTVTRLGHVSRWNIVNTSRQQSVAEHSAIVALLAMRLCEKLKLGTDIKRQCSEYALVHDMPEALTGDIPSPTKDEIDGLDELEHDLIGDGSGYTTRPIVMSIVSVCDLMEAYLFLAENGVGVHARTVADELRGHLLGLCARREANIPTLQATVQDMIYRETGEVQQVGDKYES